MQRKMANNRYRAQATPIRSALLVPSVVVLPVSIILPL